MQNYQETDVVGTAWVRARRVVIENPRGGVPAATFIEERVVNIAGGDEIVQQLGSVVEPFIATGDDANADEQFPVRNPQTGEQTGTMTYAQAHAVLHSLYYHVAGKRDALNQGVDPA